MNEGDKKAWEHALPNIVGDMVSEDEVKKLCLSFLLGRGEKGATEQEMDELIGWARYVRIQHGFLENLLIGRAYVKDMVDGEPQISLSELGIKEGARLAESLGLPVDEAEDGK